MSAPTRPTATPIDPLPRCCDRHADWGTLTQHLDLDFTEVAFTDVLREVQRAKAAVEAVRLEHDDRLEIGELIARQQLMLLAGRVSDVARLDPEVHRRGSRAESELADA